MLSRKEQMRNPNFMPTEWVAKVEGLINEVYGQKAMAIDKAVQIAGITYPDELFIALCLHNPNVIEEIPVTFALSADLDDKVKVEALIDDMIDALGPFLDQYFNDSNWNDYDSFWQETKFGKSVFYYQTTRENIALAIEAERILDQDLKNN